MTSDMDRAIRRLASPTAPPETEPHTTDDDNEAVREPADPPSSEPTMDQRIRALVGHKTLPRTKEKST
jgi:hypothetical protein